MSVLLGFAIGVAAYAMLYVGKGLQKLAIEGFKGKPGIKEGLVSRHSGTWTAGFVLTTAYMFVQWAALLYAPVNVVASLEGVGLIVLLAFSIVVLKEPITRVEIGSVAFIIVGIIFVTLFDVNSSMVTSANVSSSSYYMALVVILAVEGAAILITRVRAPRYTGVSLGVTAGTFMAFQTVAKRVTAANDPSLGLPFTVLVFVSAVLTLLVTQFALAKGKANRVLPVFTSTSIFLATLLGALVLGEIVLLVQVAGLVLVVFGVVCITAIGKDARSPDAMKEAIVQHSEGDPEK